MSPSTRCYVQCMVKANFAAYSHPAYTRHPCSLLTLASGWPSHANPKFQMPPCQKPSRFSLFQRIIQLTTTHLAATLSTTALAWGRALKPRHARTPPYPDPEVLERSTVQGTLIIDWILPDDRYRTTRRLAVYQRCRLSSSTSPQPSHVYKATKIYSDANMTVSKAL